MGNVPVIAEFKTACESLGDVMRGDVDAARRRWEDYSEASVIGSGVRAAIAASQGNMPEAERLGKAMGRATGSAVTGGGFLRDLPVFHEIATAGDSLGDMMAGGDMDAANKRWVDYSENSVVGSGVRAAIAASHGDMEEATRYGQIQLCSQCLHCQLCPLQATKRNFYSMVHRKLISIPCVKIPGESHFSRCSLVQTYREK